jgi:PAS domain S-box-containing protein
VLEVGHAIAISDVTDTPYMSARITETFKTKSVLGLPLIARGRKLGSIVFDYKSAHQFTDEEIATGERASRQVALALSNALLYKEITDQHGQLQALTESSRDGIILVSLTQRILFCNRTTLSLLGFSGQTADWVGAPLSRALKMLVSKSPSLVESALTELRRIEQGDEPPVDAEHEVLGRHLRWVSLPVLAAGEPLGRLIVLRDVSEERALERMREDLTHMMVHDLRSPLTVMMIATETLEDTKGSRRNSDLTGMIRDASTRMLNLVDAILDLSQLEANRMPMERTPIALSMLVDKTLQLNTGVAEKKKISIKAELPKDLPYLWADMRLVDRVIQNLLNNAIKFTPVGGTIRLCAQFDELDPKIALISVFNSGPGIPVDIKSRLFQKFVRGRQKEQGNGLGLAFCRLVVEAHEGHIWVESEPGQGATFYFTLPIHQASN